MHEVYFIYYCSSTLKQKNTSGATVQHQLEKVAFQKCSVAIVDRLDVLKILPNLNSKGLLTDHDFEMLQNMALTRVEKVHHLLDALPRKDRFLKNLKSAFVKQSLEPDMGEYLKHCKKVTFKKLGKQFLKLMLQE